MINVLVVDDDHLVRKGLISTMPWHLYDMKVVGEAGNGEKALEFLKFNQVDLLMTDLSMPVISGIELIRIVRKQYPKLAIVILTMHQDFELIQEALRLGVVDYIAKVELEREQFEEVLSRIHATILHSKEKQIEATVGGADCYTSNDIYILASLKEAVATKQIDELMHPNWESIFKGELMVLTSSVSEEVGDEKIELGQLTNLPITFDSKKWRILKIMNVKGTMKNELHQLIMQYRKHRLFYEHYLNETSLIEKTVDELRNIQLELDANVVEGIRKELHSYQWIVDNSSFQDLIEQVLKSQLAQTLLQQLLHDFIVNWNRLFKAIAPIERNIPNTFICWNDVEIWLSTFREHVQATFGYYQMNRDVGKSIMKAINIIHDEFASPLFAINVANRVNISRSYFNDCFKKITSYSFNEYLRKVRIDQAKNYLTRTVKPISWIAEHTGYKDDKYFSRVFREQTGLLPSEYRQLHKSG